MKGQQLRLLVAGKCIAASTSCELSVNVNTENNTTKDSEGDWDSNEVVGKSWSASAEMQFVLTDNKTASAPDAKTINDILGMIGTSQTVSLYTTTGTAGSMNRAAVSGEPVARGSAIITSLNITSQNRQTVTASVQFVGNGPLEQPTPRPTA